MEKPNVPCHPATPAFWTLGILDMRKGSMVRSPSARCPRSSVPICQDLEGVLENHSQKGSQSCVPPHESNTRLLLIRTNSGPRPYISVPNQKNICLCRLWPQESVFAFAFQRSHTSVSPGRSLLSQSRRRRENSGRGHFLAQGLHCCEQRLKSSECPPSPADCKSKRSQRSLRPRHCVCVFMSKPFRGPTGGQTPWLLEGLDYLKSCQKQEQP